MPPITDVVKNLLIINVLFFFATLLFGEPAVLDLLALHYPTSDKFQPIQIASHFFLHGGLGHIFFNMFALVMFGSALEALWGPKRFLWFYFACAFGAAALHTAFNWWEFSQVQQSIDAFSAQPSVGIFSQFVEDYPLKRMAYSNGMDGAAYAAQVLADMQKGATPENIVQARQIMTDWYNANIDAPVVGASGAIYGLLLAFGMQFPNVELMLIFLPIPIKAKYFIPILMVIELYLGVNQFSWDNIAHFAHLGGAVTGFFLILYWRKFGSRF